MEEETITKMMLNKYLKIYMNKTLIKQFTN